MDRGRDRWVASAAAVLVLGLAALIVATVLSAERNGRHALEVLQTAQVQQLANGMEKRLDGIDGVAAGLRQTGFTLQPRGADDARVLASFTLDPNARTGVILVDADGTVVNGVLLGNLSIGDRLDLPALSAAQALPTYTILPVQHGLTTAGLAMPIVFPLEGGRGAVIAESEVSVDSAFNAEVAELGRADTGEFFFLDPEGTVLASSNPVLLGQTLPDAGELVGRSGLEHIGGQVVVAAAVPRVGWTAVFRQDTSEFEGGLTGQLQRAVLLLALAALLGAAVLFVALVRRLRAAREEQRRLAEINAAREEFISIVSHELRTPVAGVLGFLETSLDHWDDMADSDRHNAISRAAANARRLQALTRDVLDTATIEAGELTCVLEDVDLTATVEDAVTAAREIYSDRVLTYDRPPEPVRAHADSDRIGQVLANLIDNAVKSSPPDTAVAVAVTTEDSDALISVSDSGAGLPEESLPRLFDKFVRGRGSTVRGTGLGLFIAHQIVQAHHGRIWAENLPGRGARLSVAIPLAIPAEQAGADR